MKIKYNIWLRKKIDPSLLGFSSTGVNQPKPSEERWQEIKGSMDNAETITENRWSGGDNVTVEPSFIKQVKKEEKQGNLKVEGTVFDGFERKIVVEQEQL